MIEEPHAAEDRLDPLPQQRQRMAMAERRLPARAASGRLRRRADGLRRGADALVELRFDLLFEIVGELAEPRARLGGAEPERLQQPETSPPFRARYRSRTPRSAGTVVAAARSRSKSARSASIWESDMRAWLQGSG